MAEKPPYITKLGSLRNFLEGIPTRGTPTKVSVAYLKEIGFTSSADMPVIPILKNIGFLSSTGVPTDRFKQYRDPRKAKRVLAEGIREGYSDVYETYPDAHNKSNDDIKAFYRAKTDLGDRAQTAIVSTFKALSALADFRDIVEGPRVAKKAVQVGRKVGGPVPEMLPLTLNINIQLQLPATDDPSVYNTLFEAMSKHLVRLQREELE